MSGARGDDKSDPAKLELSAFAVYQIGDNGADGIEPQPVSQTPVLRPESRPAEAQPSPVATSRGDDVHPPTELPPYRSTQRRTLSVPEVKTTQPVLQAGSRATEAQSNLVAISRDNGKRPSIEMPSQRGAQVKEARLINLYEGGKRDFSGTDLQAANLQGASLQNARLIMANLRDAQMSQANLCGARLTKADLRGANLQGAKLVRAKLCGANLHKADLRNADLGNADLREADLSGANLLGANLLGAKLIGTKLDDAHLSANWRLIWEIVNNGKSAHQPDQA